MTTWDIVHVIRYENTQQPAISGYNYFQSVLKGYIELALGFVCVVY